MNGGKFYDALVRLLSYAVKEPERAATAIAARYRDFSALSAADYDELALVDGVGERGAQLLRLVLELQSRRETDKLKLMKKHTEEEIISYFRALFLPLVNETVFVMLLDESERVISCELVGEGTVNAASVLPRKVLELAVRKNAKSAVMAHNHPSGIPEPSVEDIATTERVAKLLSSAGKRLVCHYVFAGKEHGCIDVPEI